MKKIGKFEKKIIKKIESASDKKLKAYFWLDGVLVIIIVIILAVMLKRGLR